MIRIFTRKGSGAAIAINPLLVEHAHDPGGGVIMIMAGGGKFQVEGTLDEVVGKLNDAK